MANTIYGHTTRSWNNLVQRGKDLMEREDDVRWAWADLFLALTPVSLFPTGIQKRRTGELTLREVFSAFKRVTLCEQTVNTMMEHRMVAMNWPKKNRIKGAGWSAHRALVGHPNRFEVLEPGMTYKDAAIAAGRDLTHLKNRVNKAGKYSEVTYETVYDHIQWANRLIRLAGAESSSLKLDYIQRGRLRELLENGHKALDETERIIKTMTQKRVAA